MHRVLVVLPFYGGSLPIGRYCATALADIGCVVDTFEAPAFFSAFSALQKLQTTLERLEFLENTFLQNISQAILAKVETFQPDLVLCLAQAPMTRQALRRLKEAQVPTAMWFVEDYTLFTYWRAFAPYYDIFAVIQKEPFLSELAHIGVKNALYLPLAALPSLHKPVELSKDEHKEFDASLSFLGAGYPNRQKVFEQLTSYGLKIWGTEWEDAPSLAPFVQRSGARISPEEAVKIYAATDININLHSSIHTDSLVSGGDFVNPRTFELAACNAFQLVDERSLMAELFTNDELATFTTMDEFIDKIIFFSNNPDQRTAYAAKAQKKVLREHTYQQRMQTLLAFASERIENFAIQSKATWPESLPPQIQQELQHVIATNNLAPSATFRDIIAAIKRKKGQLSETETALLFLDEWQKLYQNSPNR